MHPHTISLPEIQVKHRKVYEMWLSSLNTQAIASSYVPSITLPFQRWFKFKEAFSPNLIVECLGLASGQIKSCIDPFGGCGTTALTSQFLGIKPILSEVNPFIADVAEAKLQPYTRDNLLEEYLEVRRMVRSTPDQEYQLPGAPKTFCEPGIKGRYLYSLETFQQIIKYREAIKSISQPINARLLRVILGSTLVPLSNVLITGKGRKYRKNWQESQRTARDVDMHFERAILQALSDIERYSERATCDYSLHRGNCLDKVDEFDQADCAIFSPPYPNTFDYTDIYNVELWTLGYLQSSADNIALRNATLRSHVQSQFSGRPAALIATPLLSETIFKLDQVRGQLWNSNIPEMIQGYFADLGLLLSKLKSKLRSNASVFMIVGDSSYLDINISVGKILAEIAEELDYEVVEVRSLRKMRKSAQQGGEQSLDEWLVHVKTRNHVPCHIQVLS